MDIQVTVVIPSFNQGEFLEDAIRSVLESSIAVELIIMDGGSTDNSVDIIQKYGDQITYWQSCPDGGQAAAINDGMKRGSAPYVCWINSDDYFLPDGLRYLLETLSQNDATMVYGKAWNVTSNRGKANPYLTFPFSERLLANYCFICQPATLIRRDIWDQLGGLSDQYTLAFDYDFWWRVYRASGKPLYLRRFVAANRMHGKTKTHNSLDEHYDESIAVVAKHNSTVPIKWTLFRPVMKLLRNLTKLFRVRLRQS